MITDTFTLVCIGWDRAWSPSYRGGEVRGPERSVACGLLPEEHRVALRAGRSFETCDTPLRFRGSPERNLHVSPGPRGFNDYGYCHAPLCIMAKHVLLNAVLRGAVALKSAWPEEHSVDQRSR